MSIETFRAALKKQDDLNQMRLENWGQWGKGGYPDFEPASWYDIFNEYLPDERARKAAAERDAQHLESIITGFDLICRNNKDPRATGASRFGTVWCTCLKIKYNEYERPLKAMAQEARKRLKRKCAERTFQHHIQNATRAVFTWADPL